MVSIAFYYMEGEAHDWFQTLVATGLCIDWVEFKCPLQDRFQIPINEVSMEAPMEKWFKNLVQPVQESNIQEPTIQDGNTLEGALAKKIAFEDQRISEVEKINQRDLFVILNKPSLISHIEFVIPNEFKDVKIKTYLFTQMIKELVQISMVWIHILQLFKIQGRVFSNWGRRIWCGQASIFMFWNLEDKIYFEGGENFATQVLDKLFELV